MLYVAIALLYIAFQCIAIAIALLLLKLYCELMTMAVAIDVVTVTVTVIVLSLKKIPCFNYALPRCFQIRRHRSQNVSWSSVCCAVDAHGHNNPVHVFCSNDSRSHFQ